MSELGKLQSKFDLYKFRNNQRARMAVDRDDTTALGHEMLHQLFDNSALSMNPLMQNNVANTQSLGTRFLNTWEKIASSNGVSTLSKIDKHIRESYDMKKLYAADLATERFAYLGELVSKHGVSVIPKELRPYYKNIFKF